MTDPKKQEELSVLRESLSAAGLCVKAVCAGEEPDFVVELPDGNRVGIELIEAFQGERRAKMGAPLKRLSQLSSKLASELSQQCKESVDGLLVHFDLTTDDLPTRTEDLIQLASDMREIAQAVARDLAGEREAPREVWWYEYERYGQFNLVRQYIKSMRVAIMCASLQTQWRCDNVQCGEIAVPDDFITELEAKTNKADTYRKNIEGTDLWLLIHAKDEDSATFAPDPEQLARGLGDWLCSCGFDGVWFLTWPDRLCRLL